MKYSNLPKNQKHVYLVRVAIFLSIMVVPISIFFGAVILKEDIIVIAIIMVFAMMGLYFTGAVIGVLVADELKLYTNIHLEQAEKRVEEIRGVLK